MDSIFITSKANVYYYSNYYTDPHERLVGIYADRKDNPLLILPKMEEEDALRAGWKGDILSYDDDTNPWDKFLSFITDAERLPQQLAVEKSHLTVDRYEQLRKLFPNSAILDGSDLLNELRVIKDKKEYTLLKQAALLADFGVQKGIQAIEEGKSELEILADLEFALKREGVREMSFSTVVLTGAKTASPHGNPGKDKVKAGDLVLFDLGVVYEGYCSDITRTVAYKQISEQQKEVYNTVLKAQLAAIEASTIGTEVGKIDKAARSIITEHGYGEYFTHRIGHGLGIDIHEYPSMNASNKLALAEGMCYTIEPGIYIPNIGGVRIEDDIFMTKKGAEVLTEYPKELQIIG